MHSIAPNLRSFAAAAALASTLAACAGPAGGAPAPPMGSVAAAAGPRPVRCPFTGEPDAAAAEVGPEGGPVQGRRHAFTIPPGALGRRVRYTLTELPTDIIQVDVKPDGGFASGKTATLTLSYARCPATLPFDPNRLRILRRTGLGWRDVGGAVQVDTAKRTVTSSRVEHFSQYAIGSS